MSYNKQRYATDAAYREEVKARAAKWRLANKEKSSAQGTAASRRWRKRDPRGAWSAHIKAAYGLSLIQYDVLVEAAAGRCMCCGKKRKLVVDHCHTTKRVRGLICHGCNVGLGLLGDTIVGLERAIAYLKKRKQHG